MISIKPKHPLPPSLNIPNFVVYTAKIIQFFSTHLAAKLAEKLFITPYGYPKPKREKQFWKSAQKKQLLVPEISKQVNVLIYGYSKKKVLLVHGWSGRSTQFFAFADLLLENGYMIVSFDAPAHGKSEGKETSLIDFIAVVKELQNQFGPFESAIGHSLGGVTLLNSCSMFLKLKSLVVIGAGDTTSEVITNFCNNLGVHKKTELKLITILERKFDTSIDDYASSRAAKKITIPTLVIHDSKDGDVFVSCAFNIRQNLKNGQLLISSGLGHTKILRDLKTVKQSISFIVSHQS